MKQIVFTAVERAELVEAEGFLQPLAPSEVEGRTLFTAVSAGTELHSYGPNEAEKRQYPVKPGYAATFRAEAVGAEIAHIRPGDILFTSGRHASRQRARASHTAPVPAGLPPEKAVITRLMGVSWSTLATTRARPPARVAVTGLGPVGHLAAQIFRTAGYEVLAVDPDGRRREWAAAKGIAPVLPAMPLEDPAWRRKLDLVVECSGHEAAVLDACRMVRKRGEVVLVGVPWVRKTDIYAHEILRHVFYDFVDLRSGWEWEVPDLPTDFRSGSRMEIFAAGMRWLADGRVDVDDLYATVSPFEAQMAYQDLARGRAERLITLFDWREAEA
ncbi:MAG: zinc-binding alcohol dehydrogenase [Planctomycetota bacterium]|nr:zinc-binding alcohol dehydrogenase [Planctomycetota bacterium]